MSNIRRLHKALEFKDWEENVLGVHNYYNGQYSDSQIMLVTNYGLSGKNEENFFKFLNAVCYEEDTLEWAFHDKHDVDHEDNCAYAQDYGECDTIQYEGEHTGRRRFEEEGDLTFDDVSEMFVNNTEKALPSWLDPTDGWEERSCDFANGWYHRNDEPKEIAEKLWDKDLDVIFQISYVQPFETGFCVWTKERS